MSNNYYFKLKDVDKIAEQFRALSPLITNDMVNDVIKKEVISNEINRYRKQN